MKTQTPFSIKALLITFTTVFMLFQNASSQTITIDEPFTALKVVGNLTVYINKSETNNISVEKSGNDSPAKEMFQYYVENEVLNIKSTNKVEDLHLLVNYVRLESVVFGGVSTVNSRNTFTADSLILIADSLSEANLDLNVTSLIVNANGASTLKLKGKAQQLDLTASGVAYIDALNMNVKNANIKTSGLSNVKIHVIENASVKAKGVSVIKLKEKPTNAMTSVAGAATVKLGEDVIQDKLLKAITSSPDKSDRKKRFNGHWAGLEFGINTFVDNNFNTTLSSEYDFLELNIPKSITIHFNLFEQNVPILKNNFGLVTGLGLWVNNYRFSNNIILVNDSATIFGFADTIKDYVKSKLTTSYLVLPLMFEYQFRDKSGEKLLHVAAGAYGGIKLVAKTKTVYMESNKKIKNKDYEDYKLNPFKYGLTARIGFKRLNFFGNYNLSTLFENNKGPELYPFEVGISLVGW